MSTFANSALTITQSRKKLILIRDKFGIEFNNNNKILATCFPKNKSKNKSNKSANLIIMKKNKIPKTLIAKNFKHFWRPRLTERPETAEKPEKNEENITKQEIIMLFIIFMIIGILYALLY